MSAPAAIGDDVDWTQCAQCDGVMAGTRGECIRHLLERDPELAVKCLQKDYRAGELDLRGVAIDADLLAAILDAAPVSGDRRELPTVRFDWAAFVSPTTLSDVVFSGETHFTGTTFRAPLTLERVDFMRSARFLNARFERGLVAEDVTFRRGAFFDGSVFGAKLSASDVHFEGTANFNGASFADVEISDSEFAFDALFEHCAFSDETSVRDTRFARVSLSRSTFADALFGPLLVTGGVELDDATTDGRFRLRASARTVSCRGARFHRGALLEVRWADVALEGAVFGASSLISTPPGSYGDETAAGLFEEDELRDACWADDELDGFKRSDRARIVSLQRSDVEHLTLGRVDLRGCRFFGAYALQGLVIESTDAFGEPPGRWLRTRRQTISEEHEWRSRRSSSTTRNWFDGAVRPGHEAAPAPRLAPAQIATIYRQLRKGREEGKDEPGAADFYYGEMEMRRQRRRGEPTEEPAGATALAHGARTRAERAVITAYWALSGYGLRASRAVVALLVALALFAPTFYLYGFQDRAHPYASAASVQQCQKEKRPECQALGFPPSAADLLDGLGSLDAWAYAVGTATSVIGGPESQLTSEGRVMRIVLRLLGPLLIGLALLAVRGRVKR